MNKKKNINDQIIGFQKLDEKTVSIDRKLDELINLLEQSDLDSETMSRFQDKFNQAVEHNKVTAQELKEFEKLDDESLTRMERIDDLENLLSRYQVDSTVAQQHAPKPGTRKVTLLLIAILLIALGFAMIVMPAPPNFEMFTIFYFSTDDGVTLMDLISLIIVFAGIYLFVSSIYNFKRQS